MPAYEPLTRHRAAAFDLQRAVTAPSVSHRVAASAANREAVHPPERSAEATRPATASGVTAKPTVSPGATRLDRLSVTMTRSGAYAASGGGSSRKNA